MESITGALCGYLFLYGVNALFKYVRHVNGIGEGDLDLILFIGSFTGIIGCWMSITLGSILGSLYALCIIVTCGNNNNFATMKIPFGPFLACGAMLYVLAHKQILYYFF
jgi:leader peptidase (prepilin peptidase)/N-methyltransferase